MSPAYLMGRLDDARASNSELVIEEVSRSGLLFAHMNDPSATNV